MFINQMRSWENLKVDELVKLSRLFQSDTLKNLNTRPVGVGTHELRLNKIYSRPLQHYLLFIFEFYLPVLHTKTGH